MSWARSTNTAGKLGDRHHFHDGDADRLHIRQPFGRRAPGTFRGKGAEVHFVHHLAFDGDAPPGSVRPSVPRRVDDLGRSGDAVRLKPRTGIREQFAVEAVPVPRTGASITNDGSEIPVWVAVERHVDVRPRLRMYHQVDVARARRPHAEGGRPVGLHVRTGRQTSGDTTHQLFAHDRPQMLQG
jgi:hypothetical protein